MDRRKAVLPARLLAVAFNNFRHRVTVTGDVPIDALLHYLRFLVFARRLSMLDGISPRHDGIAQTFAAKGVGSYPAMMTVRLIHDRLNFLQSKGRLNV